MFLYVSAITGYWCWINILSTHSSLCIIHLDDATGSYALFLNRIRSEVKKILRKKQNGFQKSTTSQILIIYGILKGVRARNLKATRRFAHFLKTSDSIERGKLEQILLAYGLPWETETSIIMFYRNTKSIIAHLMATQTSLTLLPESCIRAPSFIICLDYVDAKQKIMVSPQQEKKEKIGKNQMISDKNLW